MGSSGGVVKNISYNWVGLFVTLVLGFIQAPIVVLSLGNKWYGIWILIQQLTTYTWLFDIGIREAVVRYVSKLHVQSEFDKMNRILSSAIYLYVLISIITLMAILLIAIILPYLFKIPKDTIDVARVVLLLGGINIASNWIFNTHSGILMGLKRFDIFQKIGICMGLVNFTLVITFLKIGYGIISLSIIALVTSVFSNLLIYKQSRKLLPEFRLIRFSSKKMQFKVLINYGKFILLNNIGTKIIQASDALLIGAFLTPSAITFYAIPRLLIIYMEKIVGVGTWVLVPVFSELEKKEDNKKIISVLKQGTKMSLLIGVPIGIVYLIMGKEFISLWMGNQYGENGKIVLVILTISAVSAIWMHVINSALYGIGRHHIIAYLRITEAGLNIILSLMFLKIWGLGIEGVALGTAISHILVMFFILPVIVCRNLEISIVKYLKDGVLFPLLSGIPFAFCCYAINSKFQAQNIFIFFGLIALLMPVFILSAWFFSFSKKERDHFFSIIRKFVPNRKNNLKGKVT